MLCSWEDGQKARVAAIDKWRTAKGQEKHKLLIDVLILAFHTLQPVPLPAVVDTLCCTASHHAVPLVCTSPIVSA